MGYKGFRFNQQKAHKAIDNAEAMVAKLRSFALAIRASGADQGEANTLEAAAAIVERHLNQANGFTFNRNGGVFNAVR